MPWLVAGEVSRGATWYASAVHAIAIALTLSLSSASPMPVTAALVSPPETKPTAPEAEAPTPAVEPSQPEPLPDLVPDPEPAPETEPSPVPEPTPAVETTPPPEPIPPAGDEQVLAASTSDTPPPARDRLGCDGSRSCRRMSIAGIVVGSLGLVAVGAGIGMLVRPDEVLPEQPIFVSSTHPPGLVAVTIGTGVVLTAALMLGAAHKGYKQRPDESARVRVGPTGLRF
jgi:hypothetical protein